MLGETVLASAAHTATHATDDMTNRRHRGVQVVIDVTAATATPSVVFTIQGKCPVSNQYYTILTSAAITGVSTTVLRAYPGFTASANVTANDAIPVTWRILCTHTDADSITYSIGVNRLD